MKNGSEVSPSTQLRLQFVLSVFMARSPFRSESVFERTDTARTRNWAAAERPLFAPAGVYTVDGRMDTVRTAGGRIAT